MAVKNHPKPGRYKEQRIIAGVLHNVITENGKIVKDLGAVNRDQEKQPSMIKTPNDTEEEPKVEEEKPRIGIPLVSEDDSYIDPSRKAEEVDNTIIKPNDTSQKQKPRSAIHLTPVSAEELGDILKQDKQEKVNLVQMPKLGKKPELENILSKIPEPDPDRQNPPGPIEQPKPTEQPKEEPRKSNIPIIEPVKKSPQVPKITIPKVQINIPPKNTVNEPIKLENISNKLGDILATDTYPKTNETKVVEQNLQKANENVLTQQPVTNREKSTKEKRRFMSEELEAELLDERKFEQWMKKQKFRENLEKAAKFAEETKSQFEEKIPELSSKIEGITGDVKNVDNRLDTFSSNIDNRLGTVDKSIGTLCTGIDCVKEDVKKYQTSQEALEKLVQERFGQLAEKVESLERPTFTCENCGEQVIAPLSSYCPNCGSEIQSWSDEDGQPVRGWAPYWKRSGRSTSQ